MKKLLLLGGLLLSSSLIFSQNVLFSDDFEAGQSNWSLNGGTGEGDNAWIVNNEYDGLSYLGINNTPNQPAGVTNGPRSNYLHITNNTICGLLATCNSNYDADNFSSQFATMATPVSTTGLSNVTLSFYYVCIGAQGYAQGELEYSTDNGANWTHIQVYHSTSNWTLETITLPAWDNQANLSFRFKWINTGNGLGSDPAFSIDEVSITSGGGGGTVADLTNIRPEDLDGWCYNDQSTFNVGLTATGTFNSGNVFTAELSDANGNFTNPVVIGTLNSSTGGSILIPCTIPTNTPVGNGYRIRVVSSDPAIVSADNGVDLSVFPIPTISAGSDMTVCEGDTVILTGSGGVSYIWDNGGQDGFAFVPTLGTHNYTVTGYNADGCSSTDSMTLTVEECDDENPDDENPDDGEEDDDTNSISINELSKQFVVFPNPANDNFKIEGNNQVENISIVDLNGRIVKLFQPSVENQYSLEGISNGSYFVNILVNNQVVVKKLIKK